VKQYDGRWAIWGIIQIHRRIKKNTKRGKVGHGDTGGRNRNLFSKKGLRQSCTLWSVFNTGLYIVDVLTKINKSKIRTSIFPKMQISELIFCRRYNSSSSDQYFYKKSDDCGIVVNGNLKLIQQRLKQWYCRRNGDGK
jgi:hypothetical protein